VTNRQPQGRSTTQADCRWHGSSGQVGVADDEGDMEVLVVAQVVLCLSPCVSAISLWSEVKITTVLSPCPEAMSASSTISRLRS
jgi:hypothetical protein